MTTLDTLIDYKQLVEALADAVLVADPDGAIQFWNPAAERLFGFTEVEALGSLLLSFLSDFESATGPVTKKPWPPDKRGTHMMCCVFRPCIKTDDRCR